MNKQQIDETVISLAGALELMKGLGIITPLQQKKIRTNLKVWAYDSIKGLVTGDE